MFKAVDLRTARHYTTLTHTQVVHDHPFLSRRETLQQEQWPAF